ncbi:signal peptidase II [Pelistega ratti]|uniref:signal peptidase II n=1 Tax=Pelistega ratti TaxID=2652177 RepID=UPI001FAB1123|nr:signal peptidase II [Pelistega ratti]
MPSSQLVQKPFSFWAILAIILIALDQASKLYVEHTFEFAERVNVLPFFDFILIYNTGAAFSIGAEAGGWQRWLFIALAFGACAFIIYLLKTHKEQPFFCFALSLILAGAAGNLIDRIAYGHVIDFLLFYWEDWQFYFPAFNLADCFITIGATLIIIEELFFRKNN